MALNIKYKSCHTNQHKTLNVWTFFFICFWEIKHFVFSKKNNRAVGVFWAIYWCFAWFYKIHYNFLYIWTYFEIYVEIKFQLKKNEHFCSYSDGPKMFPPPLPSPSPVSAKVSCQGAIKLEKNTLLMIFYGFHEKIEKVACQAAQKGVSTKKTRKL